MLKTHLSSKWVLNLLKILKTVILFLLKKQFSTLTFSPYLLFRSRLTLNKSLFSSPCGWHEKNNTQHVSFSSFFLASIVPLLSLPRHRTPWLPTLCFKLSAEKKKAHPACGPGVCAGFIGVQENKWAGNAFILTGTCYPAALEQNESTPFVVKQGGKK